MTKNLLFQFAERAVYIRRHSLFMTTRQQDTRENPWNSVGWECDRADLWMPPAFNFVSRVQLTWMMVEQRSTSKAEDEPICVATLLGLDLEKLLQPPDTGSVKKFWSLHIDGIPPCVIFLKGRKLQDKGYNWAPASCLDVHAMTPMKNANYETVAQITSHGLLMTWPGFTLSQPRNIRRYVIVCELEGETYFVRRNRFDGYSTGWDNIQVHQINKLAVLVTSKIQGSKGVDATAGALVEIEKMGERLFVKYLRLVSVIKKDSRLDKHPSTPWSGDEQVEKMAPSVEAHHLPFNQKWLVG
jgi:hypothetical protein